MINSLKTKSKLNVGCGADYREGWVNLDMHRTNEVKPDVVHDLRKLPLPFKDNTFDHIFTAHTLEHIEGKLTGLMIEFHRILKPNGTIEIRVPHASFIGALEGMEHRNMFCEGSFGQFCDPSYFKHMPEFPKLANRKEPLFGQVRFTLKKQRTDDGRRFLIKKKGAYYYFAKMISFLANCNPTFCERIWVYWFGGFQEMQVVLRKK